MFVAQPSLPALIYTATILIFPSSLFGFTLTANKHLSIAMAGYYSPQPIYPYGIQQMPPQPQQNPYQYSPSMHPRGPVESIPSEIGKLRSNTKATKTTPF